MDIETREGLGKIILPSREAATAHIGDHREGVDLDEIYNAKCNEMIVSALRKIEAENVSKLEEWDPVALGNPPVQLQRPMIRTRYPNDDDDSEDVVSLGRDGEIVVLDMGTR